VVRSRRNDPTPAQDPREGAIDTPNTVRAPGRSTQATPGVVRTHPIAGKGWVRPA
jgi:hypothetical protein